MKCPYCPREYTTKEKLQSHINANHWKKLHPGKKGKPSPLRRRRRR